MKNWQRGTLKTNLLDLSKGLTVIVSQSVLHHRMINKTYWIISPELKKAYHVADTMAGKDCKYLVRLERPAKDQQRCADLAIRLCKNGQFGPQKQAEIRALLSRR